MSKEGIIDKVLAEQRIVKWTGYFKRAMSAAMDVYAKQEAIEFHVFVTRQKLKRNNLTRLWKEEGAGAQLTDKEVWETYLQYKEYLKSNDSAF